MKNTFAQLHLLVSRIDRRYIQAASLAFTLIAAFIMQKPDDGSGGIR